MAKESKQEPDGIVEVRGRRGKDGFEVVLLSRKAGSVTEKVVRATEDRRIAGDVLGRTFAEAFR